MKVLQMIVVVQMVAGSLAGEAWLGHLPRHQAGALNQLEELPGALNLSMMMDKIQWGLAFQFGEPKPEYKPRTAEQIVSEVNTFEPGKATLPQQVPVKQYRAELAQVFGSLRLVGRQLGQFVSLKGNLPVTFPSKAGEPAVLLTGVASPTVYNTLQLDVNKRALSALRSMILPSLKAFDAFKEAKAIRHYGMSVVYGSKDFLDKSPLATVPESLTFIVSADLCHKFIVGELTEEDLVAAADVFLSDRDMVTGFRKIRLSLSAPAAPHLDLRATHASRWH